MVTGKITLRNELGIITDNRIIIYQGKDPNVIYVDTIKKINLIKKRKFFTNLLFMVLAGLSILAYDIHMPVLSKLGIGLVSLTTLLLGIFHKFYLYNIIISLNDNNFIVLQKNQLQKEQIKNFYYSILSVLRKNKIGI